MTGDRLDYDWLVVSPSVFLLSPVSWINCQYGIYLNTAGTLYDAVVSCQPILMCSMERASAQHTSWLLLFQNGKSTLTFGGFATCDGYYLSNSSKTAESMLVLSLCNTWSFHMYSHTLFLLACWSSSRVLGGSFWGNLGPAVGGQRGTGRRLPGQVPRRRRGGKESAGHQRDRDQTPPQTQAPQHHHFQVR